MIPYELIIPSASRPHLLDIALPSILRNVDQLPQRIIVHNDEAFPDRAMDTMEVVQGYSRVFDVPYVYQNDKEPLGHGPSLAKLLEQVGTEYALYSQDDLKVIRPLPITQCLEVMQQYELHHVRFNKRATMHGKGIGEARWYKKEFTYQLPKEATPEHPVPVLHTLTISDHWYFQTALNRVDPLRQVCRWFVQTSNAFHEHCEMKINKAFNGQMDYDGPGVFRGENPMDVDERAVQQRTFIWGPIGHDRYIDNLSTNPDDWALVRPRGGQGPARVDSQARE